MTALAKVAALTGTALLSIIIVLSSKYKILDKITGGLDTLYHIHHIGGQIALILLVLHPIFLAAGLLVVSPDSSLEVFLPTKRLDVNIGQLSLWLMVSIIGVSVYTRVRYQTRKKLHDLLGVALLLGGMHAFLTRANVYSLEPLRWYMLMLVGLALVNYAHTTLLGSIFEPKIRYRVNEVNSLGENVTEIVMAPIEKKIVFTPGQFIIVRFTQEGFTEPHWFSISSSSCDDVIKLSVKALGDWTSAIPGLSVNAEALIDGPFGGFSYRNTQNRRQVWIAGGIGITPFISMARTMRDRSENDFSVDLFYSFRNHSEALYLNELKEMEPVIGIRVFSISSFTDGRLSVEMISRMIGSLSNREVLICGPRLMLDTMKSQLRAHGVPGSQIHTEEYKLL